MVHGPNCTHCLSDYWRRRSQPLTESTIKIDNPHSPWGKHVDIITPLESGIRGVQKMRINANGNILTEDFNVKF